MSRNTEYDIGKTIDAAPISIFQWLVVLLCTLTALLDGIDVQTMALVTPLVAKDWGVERSTFGLVLSAGFAGIMLGAMGGGALGDWIGRKRVLVCAFTVVGFMSILTALARHHTDLMALRFLTGLGIGACMPNFTALMAEYVPVRRQSLFVTILFSAIPVGGVIGGYVAPILAAEFGWRSVFIAAGIFPLVLTVALLAWLPESVRFLAVNPKTRARAGAILARIDKAYVYDPGHRYATEAPKAKSSVAQLFEPGLASVTVLLWATFFFSLFALYMLTSWLPSVLTGEGWAPAQAAQSISIFFLGGMVGGIAAGWLMDRLGPYAVLGTAFACGSAAIFMLGRVEVRPGPMFAVIGLTGLAIVGGQTGATALAARLYPPSIRATGVGWGLGVGRSGAVVSRQKGAAQRRGKPKRHLRIPA